MNQLITEGKIPPHSLEIEMNFLGGLIIDNSLIEIVTTEYGITPEMFYSAKNSLIFTAIKAIYFNHIPVDLITLTEELKLRDELDAVGGPYYLTELTTSFTSSETVGYSSEKIYDYWLKRDIINVSSAIRDKCFDPTSQTDELLREMEKEILTKREKEHDTATPFNLSSDMELLTDTAGLGLLTGYGQIDQHIGQLSFGDLILIGGRPSHGKSAFMGSLMENLAVKYPNESQYLFSIENKRRKIVARRISQVAKINSKDILYKHLTLEQLENINSHNEKFKNRATIFIDDKTRKFEKIANKIILYKRKYGVRVFFIDYLQLINFKQYNSNRNLDLAYISHELKGIAKDEDILIIAIVTLSRATELRGNKRPILSDLRECGDLEYDGDVIMFVYRENIFVIEDNLNPDYQKYKKPEIIIAKTRDGDTGILDFYFEPQYTRFEELSNLEPF